MIKFSKYSPKPFENPNLTFTNNFVQPMKYFKSSYSVSKPGLLNASKPIAQVPPYKQHNNKNDELHHVNGITENIMTLSFRKQGYFLKFQVFYTL